MPADPIQEKFHDQMNKLAQTLDVFFNGGSTGPEIVFLLLVGEVNNTGGGRVNYISNGNRDDMLSLMKEYLARAEGRYVEGDEEGTAQ